MRRVFFGSTLFLSLLALALCVSTASATAIRPGFDTTSDGRNDDGTYPCTNGDPGGTCPGVVQGFGFTMNFFGNNYTGAYLNTNGNITLDGNLSTYTPFNLGTTSRAIIAPFFADVDTRGGAGVLQFGSTASFLGTGQSAFGVTWNGVGYFGAHIDKLDYFQVIVIDRSDTGTGNVDIEFNYDGINWETGDASGGSGGLGGSSARVGWANGTGSYQELAGSAINGAFLDGGPNALVSHNLNCRAGIGETRYNPECGGGRYDFFVRNGQVQDFGSVPEPATLLLLGSGLVGVIARFRKSV